MSYKMEFVSNAHHINAKNAPIIALALNVMMDLACMKVVVKNAHKDAKNVTKLRFAKNVMIDLACILVLV